MRICHEKRGVMKKLFVFALMFLSLSSWAKGIDCNICGMLIEDNAPNHFILTEKEPVHACSIPCVNKAKKGVPTAKIQISDFNHREKLLDGSRSFFLIGSKNIKKDMGDMVMPPYVAAFSTKVEAVAAQKKYGDGRVVEGIDAVLKEAK